VASPAEGMAWRVGSLIAEVLRGGRCCLVPQLRFQVAGFPFAGVASTFL
jgi:hypothetical protein